MSTARRSPAGRPLVVLGVLALVPKLDGRHPVALQGRSQHARDAAAARALPALRRARAHLRPALRLHGPALVRARALLRGRRLRRRDRDDELALGLLGRGRSSPRSSGSCCRSSSARSSLRVGGIAFAMVTLAFAQAGLDPRAQEPARLDGRRGRLRRRLHEAARRRSSGSSTRRTSTGSRSATSASCSSSCAGRSTPRPGHVWQAIRENELRVEVLGLRPYCLQADVVRARVVPRDRRRHRLPAPARRRDARRDDRRTSRSTLLVMVVIGGTGSRWGALIGGILYTYAQPPARRRVVSQPVSALPYVLRTPLEQPLFVLGVLFILVVFFVPGGLARHRPRSAGGLAASKTRERPAGGDAREHRVGVARAKGAPLLLIQGLGYGALGLGAGRARLLAERYRVLSFDNRGIGESDKPPGPYTAAQMAGDALQVLDEAGVERAHVLGASLGGMIAQELASPAPERVDKLVLCCTTPGGPRRVPMPEVDAAAVRRGARRSRPRSRCAASSRTRSAPEPPPELVDELFALPAREPARPGRAGRRRPPPAWPSTGVDARDLRADAGPRTAPPTTSSTIATPSCSPSGSRARASSSSTGAGHLFFWEQPDDVRQDRRGVPRMSRLTRSTGSPRPRPDHAGPRRDRGGGPHVDLRRPRRALRRARARRSRRGDARLDADRQLGRARGAVLRVREGGRDPAPDLVAARAGRDRLPARRRRAGALPGRGRATASSAKRRSRSRALAPRRSSSARPGAGERRPTTTRCS